MIFFTEPIRRFFLMLDKVKLIIDTDLGADCDDVGALCLAMQLDNEGYCDILAIGHCVREEGGIQCVSVLKNFYKKSFPIGRYYGKDYPNDNHRHLYDLKVNEKYKKYLDKNFDYIDAYKLYRKVLASQDDNSVIIATIGELSNIAALLDSKADKYSPLSGQELVQKKVKRFVVMGGLFNDGSPVTKYNSNTPFGEYNLGCDIEATRTFINLKNKETVYLDFYDGIFVNTVGFCNEEHRESPLVDAYRFYCNGARASWDLLTVYYAVFNKLFDKLGPYKIDVDDHAITHAEPGGYDYYLRPNVELKEMEIELNNILKRLEDTIDGTN